LLQREFEFKQNTFYLNSLIIPEEIVEIALGFADNYFKRKTKRKNV
jgi:hypothetical protein